MGTSSSFPAVSSATGTTLTLPVEAPVGRVIRRVDPAQVENWDALLADHPRASFFHGAAWARVLTGAYGYVPAYVLGTESGALRSLLPLMEIDSWLTGRRGIALPFTDDCEPLCADAASFQELLQHALEFGRERGWKHLECRGGRQWMGDAPPSVSFYEHRLDLSGGEEQLFSRLESSVRRAIRKSEKTGVTVTVSTSLESVHAFYSLLCQTRKKHGLPPQPFAFFRQIHDQVISRGLGNIIMATCEQRPIAASVYFHLRDRAIYKYGASDEAFQHLRGSNLVMWEAIKWHARQGVKELHFGRTSLANEGLRRFKLGWGTVEHGLDYLKYDFRQGRFVTGVDEASGWYNRVFRALPIPVSRLIGAALYRHSA